MSSKLPKRLEDRLCRKLKDDEVPYSYRTGSTSTSCGSLYLFSSYVSPDAFLIIIYDNKEDWTKLEYKLLTTDEKLRPCLQSIIEQYINDMYKYYQERG